MPENSASIASFWDAVAASFDEEADHGLRDPRVRAAWAERLRSWMPASPADVLDLGCGTGSLSLVLAEQGHRPVGVELLLAALRPLVETARVEPLLDPALWGRAIEDERYAVVAFA
ncbi:methyltransferase domain-containing protein [Streptosporangium sp. LJ11]|uniref:class I SAM-dependent methyltransferase n=1 Tax=Streptosporangium sp. LJ11 TaxID=3436927 RepID=UPI003F78BAD9